MKEILNKLNELCAIAEVRITKADNEREQNARKATVLADQEKALKALEESLIKREKAVTVYEDMAKALKDIEEEKQINIDTRNRLTHEKASFEDKKKHDEAELAGARALLDQQKEKLRKQSEELAEEKKNYKQKVIAEVEKNLTVKINP